MVLPFSVPAIVRTGPLNCRKLCLCMVAILKAVLLSMFCNADCQQGLPLAYLEWALEVDVEWVLDLDMALDMQ